jgi:hypothetical protein
MFYLRYLCLFAHTGSSIRHMLCCVVVLFCFSSSCVASFSGLSMFDCPSSCVPYVASFSGLSMFDCSSSCVPNVASFSGLSMFDCLVCPMLLVSLDCLRPVCPILLVSLDCLRPVSCVSNVASFSGLSSSCVLCVQCC